MIQSEAETQVPLTNENRDNCLGERENSFCGFLPTEEKTGFYDHQDKDDATITEKDGKLLN